MSVHEARKVRFYGLDIWNTHLGRERVLAHLKIVAPEQITLIEPLFREVAAGEARGLLRAHERVDIQSFIKLQRLTEFLSANSDSFARQTSVDDCLDVDQHLRVILRWMSANLSDKIVYELPLQVPNKAGLNNFARSWYMAENLLDGMARDEVGSKVVVWAHVFHLGVGVEDPTLGVTANMGKYLRERFGEQYYVFGLELDGGTYLARVWRLDDTLGDFKIGTLPAAPEGTLPWHLSRTNMRSLMLDLRNCPKSQEIQRWLGTPQDMHAVSWLHRDEQVRYIKQSILQVYDGIIFIGHTSATTPSKNAHRTVSERPETCTRTKAVW
jgi:erythromycin esterase-like protein